MQALRDILRQSLKSSLDKLAPLDRLAAAWPVAAGHSIARHSAVISLQNGVATVEVTTPEWLQQLRSMTPQLRGDLQQVSGIPLTDILFVLPPSRNQGSRAAAVRPR